MNRVEKTYSVIVGAGLVLVFAGAVATRFYDQVHPEAVRAPDLTIMARVHL